MNNATIATTEPGQVLHDDKVKGLQLRAFPGRKSFYLYYRTRGSVERRPKIGDFGTFTLVQARDVARAILQRVAAGEDPGNQWSAAKGEPTVQELFDRVYEETWGRKPDADWSKEAKRLYTKHLKPTFGAAKVSAPTLDDVSRWYAKMAGTPTLANRCLSVLRRMFRRAERYGWRAAGTNPCLLDAEDKFKETSRGRFANQGDLAKLGPLLEREAADNPTGVAFLLLLLYSGSRPRAIERVRWDELTVVEVEGQRFGVLKFAGKTGAETVILPPQAMVVLDACPRTSGTITGRKMPRKLWNRVRKEAGCPDLWARDLRRTFATVGLSHGQTSGAMGELLNHKSAQTTMIYAKLMDGARMAAAAGTADAIEGMLGKKPPPVESFGAAPKDLRPEQAEPLGDEVVGGRRVVDRLGDDLPEAKEPGLADAHVDQTALEPVAAVLGKNTRAA